VDDLVARVSATVAQFFGENDSPENVARAVIPIVLEEAAAIAHSARLPDALILHPSDHAYNQAVGEVAQSIRSRVSEMER
jgi:hypothetical protein